MPIGLVLVEWDNAIGPEINAKFPKTFSFSKDEINKILMSHSISKSLNPELLELRILDRIILSYCAKDKVPTIGYNMVAIVFSKNEADQIDLYKEDLKLRGKEIFDNFGFKRIKLFKAYIKFLFKKKSTRKCLFIGPSSAGKSSIKKFYFEAIPAATLLKKPLEPTYGLEHFNYNWLDLDLGIADLAGQEIDHFLNDSLESEIDPFESVDVILYIFDTSYWEDNSKKVVEHLKSIDEIRKSRNPNSILFVFCHKIDLIESSKRKKYKNEILYTLPANVQDFIFFTSIKQTLIYTLIRGMQKIIGTLSVRTSNMEEVIFEVLRNKSSTTVVILNEKNIILEVSTKGSKDINFPILKKFIGSSYSLIQSFEKENNSLNEIHLNGKNFNFLFSSLESNEKEKIIIISEILNKKEMINLRETIEYSLLYLETSYLNKAINEDDKDSKNNKDNRVDKDNKDDKDDELMNLMKKHEFLIKR